MGNCDCGAGNVSCGRVLEKGKYDELEQYIGSLKIDPAEDRRRGVLIQTLHRAQGIFGFLPEEVQKFVADKLNIPVAEIYGIISFYSFFTDKPIGRYKINVCTGTACFVKGANRILDEFKRHLNVKEGESSEDGKFFLGALRCVGACSLAPVVMINETIYGNMTPERVAELIAECKD